MAKLARKNLTLFGNAGASSNFGEFGSKAAGLPDTSKDPAVIQDLGAWSQGWQDAVVAGNKAAYLEDMNGWCYVHSYMMAYMYQMGIAEWDSQTTYFEDSVVQVAGQWFSSQQDNNLNNTPPTGASNAWWQWVNPPQDLVGGTPTLHALQKVTDTTPSNGVAGSTELGDSALSDNGVNVITSLPLQFPDATVQSTAAQNIANQNVVTGSRAFNIAYHNTSSKALFVSVTCFFTVGTIMHVYSDASATPTTEIISVGNNSTGPAISVQGFFIVLPGNYYKVVSSGSLGFWVEWT